VFSNFYSKADPRDVKINIPAALILSKNAKNRSNDFHLALRGRGRGVGTLCAVPKIRF
jgi:hypothetical protein